MRCLWVDSAVISSGKAPQSPVSADTGDLGDDELIALYAAVDRRMPRVQVNFVTSLDGAVTVDGYSAGLSNPADKRVFSLLRMTCDALLVGAGTLRHEGYGAFDLGDRRRAWRVEHGLVPDPPLVILSGRLAIDPTHPMFTKAPVRPIVITQADAPAERIAALRCVAKVIVAGTGPVDLRAAMAVLHEQGLHQVLCEGGPRVLATLTAADLVDELCLTVSAMLAGGAPGRISAGCETPAVRSMALRHVLASDDTLLLRYTRRP